MKIAHLLCCAAAAASLTVTTQARAALYAAAAASAPGELYTLNPATGAVIADIGPLADAANTNYPITGLAFHPTTGVLYGSTGNSGSVDALLVSINPATARVTVIGPFAAGPTKPDGTPATMGDLAFDAAGNLYGVATIGGPNVYAINTATGKATLVGANGVSTSTEGGGLAISPAGTFYGTPTSGRYGTYDATTGAYTNIANPAKPAGTGAYAALDFDPATGNLVGLNLGPGSPPPSHIVTINPATGAVTDLGASLNFLDAIAFSPIPEPTTATLLLLPATATLLSRRRSERV